VDIKRFNEEWETMSLAVRLEMRKELEVKRALLAKELRGLHEEILPVETELKRLMGLYEEAYKKYQETDRKLSVADGRYKIVAPVKGASYRPKKTTKKEEESLAQILMKMSPEQLLEFVMAQATKSVVKN